MKFKFFTVTTFAAVFTLTVCISSCDPQDNTNTEHCTNGIKDEDETAVDCGGALCDTCLPAPIACFTAPDTALILETPLFYTCATGATSYNWSFGDGQTSTMASPEHAYSATGVYTVKQVVSNGQSADSTTKTIEIKELRNYHYAGNYFGHTLCPGFSDNTFSANITSSGTDGIAIYFSGNFICNAVVDGHNVTIPTQVTGSTTFSGSGTLTHNRFTLTIDYSKQTPGFPDQTCTTTLQREW